MNHRLGAVLAVVGAILALVGAAFGWWRWRHVALAPPPELVQFPVSPAPTATTTPAAPHISTLIDAPGDPALVRRAALKAPRQMSLAAPAKVAPGAAKEEAEAYYVEEPLTPASGGYLGKFSANGLATDALNAQLALDGSVDAGDDDDGGDLTPDNVEAAPQTGGASQPLDAIAGGDNGRPQLKQAMLRPKIAQKIADLLFESGYEPISAQAVEAAAKRLYNIQTLRVGAVALAVGAVDPAGVYRVAQLAIYQDGEYVGTVALAENGLYGEGAEPRLPPGFLDDSDRPPVGAHFTLADGVYSAGLRSAVPEPVIREAVHLLARLVDLDASLSAGVTLKLIYARSPRVKSQPASRVIYAGLTGAAASADCYAFELSDGSYRCFVGKEDALPEIIPLPPLPLPSGNSDIPLPPERPGAGGRLSDSGAVAVGGLLAPIRGARVTSLFGMRFHPILHITRLHAGLDFGAAVGSQIRASADGVVESTGVAHGYGDRVVLKHGGYETTYNHLSEIRVSEGQKVRQGEIIALSGNSGLSTGPHLHFEYRVGGTPQDPLPHMGRETLGRLPVASLSSRPGPASPGAPAPPPEKPPEPDPAILAAFAAAKTLIDAALAEAQR